MTNRSFLFVLMVAIFSMSWSSYAQTIYTEQDMYTIKCFDSNAADNGLGGISANETYQYYYTSDDQRVRHGALNITGTETLSKADARATTTFKASANYLHGKPIGDLKESYNLVAKYDHQTMFVEWQFDAKFADGLPFGTWRFGAAMGITGEVPIENVYSFSFSDGSLTQLVSNADEYNLSGSTITSATRTLNSGEKETIANNYIVSHFYRINGDFSPVDPEQTALYNRLLAGDSVDLFEAGYELLMEKIRVYDASVFTSSYAGYPAAANINYFAPDFVVPDDYAEVYVLRRLRFQDKDAAFAACRELIRNQSSETVRQLMERIRENHYVRSLSNGYIKADTERDILLFLQGEYDRISKQEEQAIEASKTRANRDFETLLSQKFGTAYNIISADRALRSAVVVKLKQVDADFLADTLLYTDISFSHRGDVQYTTSGEKIDQKGPRLLKQVMENHELLRQYGETLKSDYKTYANVYKGYRTNFKVKSLSAYNSRIDELNQLLEQQEKYLLFFQKKNTVMVKNDDLIQKHGKNYKDVISTYKGRYSSYTLAPRIEDENEFRTVISQLDELVSVQECYEHLIDYRQRIDSGHVHIAQQAGKLYADVLKSYDALYKTYDLAPAFWTVADYNSVTPKLNNILAVQDCFLDFIELRKTATAGYTNVETAAGKDVEDVLKSYRSLFASYDLSASFTTEEAFRQKKAYMESIFTIQDCFIRYIDYRRRALNGMIEIGNTSGKEFADVSKSYQILYKSYDLSASFSTVEGYEERRGFMENILAVQDCFMNFLDYRKRVLNGCADIDGAAGNDMADVSKAYLETYKNYDQTASFSTIEEYYQKRDQMEAILVLQEACLRFIDLRKQINLNAATIKATTKGLKSTAAAYKKLHASFDLTWKADAEPTTCCQPLLDILAIQEMFASKVGTGTVETELKGVKRVDTILRVIGVN